MTKSVLGLVVGLLVAGMGCSEEVSYQSGAFEAPPGFSPEVAAKVPSVKVVPIESPCGVEAFLSEETLDLSGEVPFELATIEEQQDAGGALSSRILRWFGPQGGLVREREALMTPEQCLGIVTTRHFDARGLITEERYEIVDEAFAARIAAYVILRSATRRWHYDQEGRAVHVETDLDFDGASDLHEVTEYDPSGRMVRRERFMESTSTEDQLFGSQFMTQLGEEVWIWRSDGALARREARDASGRVELNEHTYDSAGRLLTTRDTYDGVLNTLIERRWRPDGQPESEEIDRLNSHDASTRWFYDARGRLERVDVHEDFDGDGRPERLNRTRHDPEGRVVMVEQDQPFDGRINWRERTRYDERGQKIWHQAHNLDGDTIASETRWTWDDQGRQLTEEILARGWGAVPEIRRTTYDEQGRPVRDAWFDGGENLLRDARTEYNDQGGVLRESLDQDGDGQPERLTTQRFDRAGNLLLTEVDLQGDGLIDSRRYRHYAR